MITIWQLSEPDADIMLFVFNHFSIITVVLFGLLMQLI